MRGNISYRHLTKEKRDKLSVLRGKDLKLRKIVVKIGRNIGTLSSELKRNGRSGTKNNQSENH